MFLTLLIMTFIIAIGISILTAKVFEKSISRILSRIIRDDISSAWEHYLKFAIIVVGVSGGVRIWDLEQYISPAAGVDAPRVLDSNRWILEVYRTVIGTLQSVAWMLLLFFAIALIAYVIVRGQELKRERPASDK